MKTFLLTLVLISTNLFADELAHHRFAIQLTEKSQIVTVEATVLESKSLKVEAKVFTGELDRPFLNLKPVGEPILIDEAIPTSVFSELKSKISELQNAKIEKRIYEVICLMFPRPTMSNNHLSVFREGEMKLVSSPSGCWVSKETLPSSVKAALNAQLLKQSVKVLALEALNL
ncbi:MAG: hypothetical protein VYA54_03140 [Bdellovibrionota bacterium]|nr:hypothetical protein [Bdellovibrionota bacterium]